jgi:hypothetical protein
MFLNEAFHQFFKNNGFVKFPLLNEVELDRLRALYEKTKKDSGLDEKLFFTSIWSDSQKYRESVDQELKLILEPALQRELSNFQSVFANFMVKNQGDDSQLNPHQDWSFVDEEQYDSITVWIPLCDVTKMNGALEVYRKSHRMENYIRARFQNNPFQTQMQDIALNRMESISMKTGEVLFVNSRTIHGSPPNLSNSQRVVASIVIAPKAATLLHFVQDQEDKNQAYKLEVDPRFYVNYSCFDYPEMDKQGVKVKLSLEEVTF